ncbi:MAG: RecX family transcriptional regulator, partial [Flavobacterium sp.]
YRQTLVDLLEKKKRSLQGESPLVMKQKLVRYAISKGYESEMVWAILGESESKDD